LKLQILNEFNVLKQGDTKSEIRLKLLDFSESPLDLTGKTVNIVIANSIGKVLEKTPVIDSTDTGVIYFQFSPDDVTGYGDMRLEVHVTESSGKVQIIPSNGYYKFQLDRSLDELAGGNVTSYTLQHFIDEVDQKKAELEGVANKAIDKSNEAMNKAISAEDIASGAVDTANEANAKSDSTQKQLDTVVERETDSNAESAQARVKEDGTTFTTLRNRLNASDEQLAQMNQQLSDSERQTQLLNYGLNVLDGNVGSPARFQMEGRTLVNLRGRYGRGDTLTNNYSANSTQAIVTENGDSYIEYTASYDGAEFGCYSNVTVDPSKNYLLIAKVKKGNPASFGTIYAKFAKTDFSSPITKSFIIGSSEMYVWQKVKASNLATLVDADNKVKLIATAAGGVLTGDKLKVRRMGLYELSTDEYNKIGVEWNDEEVAKRYPYVDDVKHIQAPFVMAEGENLVNEREFLSLDGYFSESDGYISRENDTSVTALAKRVVPNQDYTLSALGYVDTSTTDIKDLRLRFLDINGSYISGTTIQLSFSSITSATRLSGICTAPSNAETLEIYSLSQNVGKIYFKDVQLELGNTATPYVPYNPSYKYWMTTLGSIGDKSDLLYEKGGKDYVEKWIEKDVVLDGSRDWELHTSQVGYTNVRTENIPNLIATTSSNNGTSKVVKYDGSVLSNLYSSSSGADNHFTPVGVDNTRLVISITDADSEGYDLTTTQGIKDYFNAKPYKLSYVRAKPVTEEVEYEGSIVVNGLTQVEVGSGVIVREKANPVANSTQYLINSTWTGETASKLKNKVYKILDIYKDNTVDSKWIKYSTNAYGNEKVVIPKEDYDPTADYYVSYLVLNRHLFTSNPTDVQVVYAKSVGAALNDMAVKQGDIATDVSVLFGTTAALLRIIKGLEGA
jgi:hypothetical protein